MENAENDHTAMKSLLSSLTLARKISSPAAIQISLADTHYNILQ